MTAPAPARRTIVVIEGDDASPEAMRPSLDLVKALGLPLDFIEPVVGEPAVAEFGTPFPDSAKAAIDAAAATWFGSTSSSSGRVLFYLRWGKQTFANVRPARYMPGARSPLAHPDGIDFVIVRENLEDLYLGLEGELSDLAAMNFVSRTSRVPLADLGPGKYAIKAITEAGSERVIRFAFELARRRGRQRKLTVTSKYNMLSVSDGLFRSVGQRLAGEYPDVAFETFIVDDFAHRMIARPHDFDVVVMPNLYGDILSDGAAGLIGGLGLAPSGCYGTDYAYFESAHGTAPDIAGRNIINPTASLLSAAMMLEHIGYPDAARRIEQGIQSVFAEGRTLTPDQGGTASTTGFCAAVAHAMGL